MRRVLDVHGPIAVLTDFDGVVAPIVEDPSAAFPLDGMVHALGELRGQRTTVGLVSGRPVSFLSQFFDHRFLKIGLYGLEVSEGGMRHDLLAVEGWRESIEQVVERAATLAGDGVLIEAKGLSLTLHFRTCPDQADAVASFADAEAHRTGLNARPAKMSIELHPPIDVDKGTAIETLFADAAGVVYLGDDLGDLAALDGLDRLRANDITVASIAVDGADTPDELIDRSDVLVDGPDGALELFRSMAGKTN